MKCCSLCLLLLVSSHLVSLRILSKLSRSSCESPVELSVLFRSAWLLSLPDSWNEKWQAITMTLNYSCISLKCRLGYIPNYMDMYPSHPLPSHYGNDNKISYTVRHLDKRSVLIGHTDRCSVLIWQSYRQVLCTDLAMLWQYSDSALLVMRWVLRFF